MNSPTARQMYVIELRHITMKLVMAAFDILTLI